MSLSLEETINQLERVISVHGASTETNILRVPPHMFGGTAINMITSESVEILKLEERIGELEELEEDNRNLQESFDEAVGHLESCQDDLTKALEEITRLNIKLHSYGAS